jgi:membrane protein required for colicin V production
VTPLDFVVLAVLAVSALIGALRGLVKEAMSLLVWVAAAWLAARYGAVGAGWLTGTVDDPELRLWAGRLLVFVGILFAGSLLTWLVGYLVRRLPVTGTDRALGFGFGLARGVLLVAVLVVTLRLGGFDSEPWWRKSKLLPYAAAVTRVLEDAARRQLASPPTTVRLASGFTCGGPATCAG